MQRSDLGKCQLGIMKASFTFIVFLLALLACNKHEYQSPYLKCRIVSISDLACSKPLLDFSEDSVALRKFTGKQASLYVAGGLPGSLNIQNKLLYLSVRESKPEEAFLCNAFGVSYPALIVIDAKAR